MISIDVHLQEGPLKEAMATLAMVKEKALKRAFVRAQNKTGRWLSSQVARMVARQYGLLFKDFKQYRVQVTSASIGANTKPAIVWIGYRKVGAHLFGEPIEDRDYGGSFAKDFFFKGAFVAKNHAGEKVVYKRRSAKRLPIDVQSVEIRQGAILAVNRLIKQAEARFKTLLEQEISFELSKLK